MTNRDMAATLFNIATLLRERGENPYRIRAYESGARSLMRRRSDDMVGPLQKSHQTLPHPKFVLGDKLQRKLRQLAQTGDMEFYDQLLADLPVPIANLMRVPGIGPRTAARLYDTLGIETADDLRDMARSGRLTEVWGIGVKRREQFAQLSLFDETEPRRQAA